MTRRTMAERKRRAHERDARRESLLVLLSRTRRGVALTPAEAALMFAHVEVELAEADELRRTVAGQQNAIQAAHERQTAADQAIVEAEQDREAALAQLAEHQAATEQRPDEKAGERLRRYEAVFGPNAVEDFHAMQHRAKQAEAAITRVRETTHRMRAGSPQGAAAIYADRIEQALADDPYALTPEQTAVHVAFGEAADSTRAQLAEQQRAHEIELATVRRTLADNEKHRRALAAILAKSSATPLGELTEYAAKALKRSVERILATEHRATRYRTAWFAARRDRKADRAAMAAELPLVEAARSLLATLAPKKTTTQ